MNARIFFVVLLSLWMGATVAVAQRNENGKQRRGFSTERMAQHMAKELELNDEMTAWFVPLFKEYQDTLRTTRLNRFEIPNEKSLSDEQASQLVEIFFVADETRVALKRAYYARFKERLEPKQLLKIFMERPNFMNRNQQQRPQRNWNGPNRNQGFPENDGFREENNF